MQKFGFRGKETDLSPGFRPVLSPNYETAEPSSLGTCHGSEFRERNLPFSELQTCQTRVRPSLFSKLRTCKSSEFGERKGPNSELAESGIGPVLSPNSKPAEPRFGSVLSPNSEPCFGVRRKKKASSFLRTPKQGSETARVLSLEKEKGLSPYSEPAEPGLTQSKSEL